ncbi:J domain-containing protein [Halomicrobium salinisoli]|uniref:J domain-containing protein n=1 Tax=Halomicrobium salinisoli TaxID=2878391 RepID=UPI001CF0BB1E|nr:J domain-containing protein [Halomicrobium salinisoli]
MQLDPGAWPEWLLVGVVVGVLGSLAVAALFFVAVRYFPSRPDTRGRRGGEKRRRAELREYLDAIDEQYAEDHFVEGQHVAFYLPKRDVAITFDARAYYRIDRSPTHPVLVEHEMPGVQLGARLPFETPEVDFGPDEDEERQEHPTAAAFRELGLPTSATLEEVKSAYRDKVKEVHPDHGGDEDEFKRVREAYTTARRHAAEARPAD